MMLPLIKTEGMRKEYCLGGEPVHALAGVSLAIDSGEFVAVMGPSGSGKSTFMHLLGCLDRPTAGSYWLEGVDVAGLPSGRLARLRGQRIGFVFQNFNLLPRTSALENVELPMLYAGVPGWRRQRRARALLERVGLSEREAHLPSQLSGGQQQRVAIARALANDPALILADEPTGALDSRASRDIMALFAELNAGGTTVVLITHEAEVAAQARRVISFHDGRVVADGAAGTTGAVSVPAEVMG
jgi:putative ABC transport system ATP-binding protein